MMLAVAAALTAVMNQAFQGLEAAEAIVNETLGPAQNPHVSRVADAVVTAWPYVWEAAVIMAIFAIFTATLRWVPRY